MVFRAPVVFAVLCTAAFVACHDSHVVLQGVTLAGDAPRLSPPRTGSAVPHDTRPPAVQPKPAAPTPTLPSARQTGPVRFVVLGDGGTGGRPQYKVAAAVRKVCALRGCQFALYLGDNIYEGGANAPDDPQFRDKFETPYADLDFPFFVVLGNHDYGPYALERAEAQVAYTQRSDKWVMPDRYYTFRAGPVGFFGIDTNAVLHDPRELEAQREWLLRALSSSDARWKIVFGHHPYVSNGAHGNAGNYNGHSRSDRGLVTGQPLAELTERVVCGRAQLYLAGHDHHREWLEPTCGTHFLISGAAAKLRSMARRDDQPSRWDDNRAHGFLWVSVEGDTLLGAFYDTRGKKNYEDRIRLDEAASR